MLSLVDIAGLVVLEKKILKILSMYFLSICCYLPLEKGMVLFLNKLEPPSPKDALCQVWLVLEEKMKMLKVYRQTDRKTDDRWSQKLTWVFSSGELK